MSKKLVLSAVLVMAMACVSFGIASDGFESYPIGSIDGLGTATGGWAGAWTASHPSSPITTQYMVAPGGSPYDPDQHLDVTGLLSGSYTLQRDMTMANQDWTFGCDIKLVGNEGQRRDEGRIILRDAAGNGGMELKIGGTPFEMFQLNDMWTHVQYGDGAFPTMKILHETLGDWVHLEVDYDATANTFQLYWEEQDGTLLAHQGATGPDSSSWDGTISEVFIMGFKTYDGEDSGNGILIDGINIVPEPMTMALLGLGGLALIRRKR